MKIGFDGRTISTAEGKGYCEIAKKQVARSLLRMTSLVKFGKTTGSSGKIKLFSLDLTYAGESVRSKLNLSAAKV